MTSFSIDPSQDGITHVNIYSRGKTELGRMLSNWYHWAFDTEFDGHFESIEGYWFWLGSPDCPEREQLRRLYGWDAKKLGNEIRKKYGSRKSDPDFEVKILMAIWDKCEAHEDLFKSDVAKLPFEHYYLMRDYPVDAKAKYQWMVDGIDKCRRLLVA
jgi:hypothetical protein